MARDRSTIVVPASQGEDPTGPQNPSAVQQVPSAPVEIGTSRTEHPQVAAADSGNSSSAGHIDVRPQRGSTVDRSLLGGSEGFSTFPRPQDNPYTDFEPVAPQPPVRSRSGATRGLSRQVTKLSQAGQNTSAVDWIVPVEEKREIRTTVGERLQPTIDYAEVEREKYAKKALWTAYALNIAIGLQVLLGALTTGLAAALTGKQGSNINQAQTATALLGGAATMVASYLARARGSNEPELSITRVKDLEQFLRESRAFQMDHAHEYATPENGLDQRVENFRRRFEELLGNANGERRLAPP
ncbi:hypothetical protein BU15DRAFT_60126 [Melanogaster broomeanus]|nr:hypothetical protein BU15DRAFT_60126 [Melanogaster broomeanus]